ncbi:hypothetical protein B0T17DRAFT_291733 [Bombardia bombarda]|uniref:Uncharacterized protein n=1 Tax=Bombardia bombarda TaxID=252184 RepID=A0AA40C222_9PEZI|nr:hypothetical protein B0T17DRAFT_291733 [Bombardia bombarda]
MAQPDFAYRSSAITPNDPWLSSRSSIYDETYQNGMFDAGNNTPYRPHSVAYTHGAASSYNLPATASIGNKGHFGRGGPPGAGIGAEAMYANANAHAHAAVYNPRPTPGGYAASPVPGPGQTQQHNSYRSVSVNTSSQGGWEHHSPSDSMDDLMASPSLSDYSLDNAADGTTPPGGGKNKMNGRGRSQRRPSNRDEFGGPHQFLQRPPAEYIAMLERELPHLPTNLLVQEQDSVLTRVNDRLSQCAYDFVAKYQFPIPLAQDMRPVERPQDREWTEWVYLLKRLATKRRIPARVLYNGQIKQFVTILENSLEMRHAAKHQSRPLKDDRNILQLISAGIQVAKILKDAPAMEYLDRLYVSTEQQIQERTAAAAARFR